MDHALLVITTLEGTVAVITGGASGIGRATAIALAREGARIVVADVDTERAHEVANEISALGSAALVVPTDVGQDEAIDALRDAALARFGRVDVVMNNVGVLAIGDPPDVPLSAWNIAEQVEVFGELGPMQPPPLSVLEPDVVGALVVDAIRNDTFFLPTHAEVFDILRRKASDPEGFVTEQVQRLEAQS